MAGVCSQTNWILLRRGSWASWKPEKSRNVRKVRDISLAPGRKYWLILILIYLQFVLSCKEYGSSIRNNSCPYIVDLGYCKFIVEIFGKVYQKFTGTGILHDAEILEWPGKSGKMECWILWEPWWRELSPGKWNAEFCGNPDGGN